MSDNKNDSLDMRINQILLWKTRVNDEIHNCLMMFFCPNDRFTGSKQVTKVAIYSAITFLKELKTGGGMYFASPLKTGAISLVAEDGKENVIVTEYGKLLVGNNLVNNYLEKNKLL